VAQQLYGGWQHNYSTNTRQAGCASEQFIYSVVYAKPVVLPYPGIILCW